MKANYNTKMSKKEREKLERVCAERLANLFPIPPTKIPQYVTSTTPSKVK